MHKFFCNYNSLTLKYELSLAKGLTFGGARTMAENMLPQIRSLMQELYSTLTKIKDKDESNLDELDQDELILSNLFYSLFSSPLEIEKGGDDEELKKLYQHAFALTTRLEQLINIPEYNRSIALLKSSLQNILNGL